MYNAICLDGPAEGQEIYLHDVGLYVVVPCTVKCNATYKFNHIENGKGMCTFVGLQVPGDKT